MYLINRLKRMSESFDNHSTDKELSEYLLSHLGQNITLAKCKDDTFISKASIHRFYSKAGFSSFKNLINELNKEYNQYYYIYPKNIKKEFQDYFDNFNYYQNNLKELVNDLKHCHNIAIYGNQDEIDKFIHLYYYLYQYHIHIYSLNNWDIGSSYDVLNTFDKDDIFIIVDTSIRIQGMYEMGMNHGYLLNLSKINNECHKYYIGESNCEEYLGYKNIQVNKFHNDMGIYMLDHTICKEWKG